MKFIIIQLFLISSFKIYALTVDEAFHNFYNDEKISSIHCGRNIHHFINYLKENKVSYQSGYVVSLHDDFAALNHFDARWGSKETYDEGGNYYRSNWYFHVFAIIDGVAYDFSQRDMQTQELNDYLMKAYIPQKTTQNIFFQGKLNKEKALAAHVNRELKIYSLDGYAKDYGPAIYHGTSIELINYSLGNKMVSNETTFDKFSTMEDSKTINKDLSVTLVNPKLVTTKGTYPILADSIKACRTYGYFGSVKYKTKYEVTDDQTMFKVYSSLKIANPLSLTSNDITVSLDKDKTVGGVPNQPLLHYASEITCSDLYTVLENSELIEQN